MKKKGLLLILALVLVLTCASVFVACNNKNNDNTNEEKAIEVYIPDGTPLLAMSNMIMDGENVGGKKLNFSIIDSTTVPQSILGEKFDVAVLPTNAVAKFYTKAKKEGQAFNYQMVATSVFGSLHIIGKSTEEDNVLTAQDININVLLNEVVYITGKGGTPDVLFKKFVEEKLGDVIVDKDEKTPGKIAVQYVANGGLVIQALAGDTPKARFGIVGEPAVSTGAKKNNLKSVLSLQDAYKEMKGKDSYAQASVFVKKSLASNKTFMDALIEKMQDNITNMNAKIRAKDADYFTKTMVPALQAKGSKVGFTLQAVKNCNVDFKLAKENSAEINAYLAVYGITEVGNDFYYGL